MENHAAILGCGTMGTALAHAVGRGNRRCILWCPDEALAEAIDETKRNPRHFPDLMLGRSVAATASLERAIDSAALAVVAVGSGEFRKLAAALGDLSSRGPALLSATKGLEPDSNKRLSEVLREETRAALIGAISGPNSMQDMIASRPTALVVASPGDLALPLAREFLAHPRLYVFGSADLAGVELAAALKNIVAIAAGMAAGLDLGDNARGLIVAIGLLEIRAIATKLGGEAETFMGLAGVGDLFLTTTSPYSRNHWVGVELGRGRKLPSLVEELGRLQESAEGINSIRAGRALAAASGQSAPLTECVHAVAFEGKEPRAAIQRLLDDTCAAPYGARAAAR